MNDLSQGLKPFLAKIGSGRTLTADEAYQAFNIIMSGEAVPAQVGGLLMALAARGETIEEITGGARAMRAKMQAMYAPKGAMDIVGTGGDGTKTYNISTATAFVVAGCGVTVAKHGNRAASSKCGAADVLLRLGVHVEAEPDTVQRAIDTVGIGFMLATKHHMAMRHVMSSRIALGTRTIFNLLGPLSNPARVKFYLLGVFSEHWVEPIARVLMDIGTERAWVVHSADGCDELTLSAPSKVAILDRGRIEITTIHSSGLGLDNYQLDDIRGGSPGENAQALRDLLAGQPGAYRDTVLFNAAAALVVSGRASSLEQGVLLATNAIDSGAAEAKLKALVALTRSDTCDH